MTAQALTDDIRLPGALDPPKAGAKRDPATQPFGFIKPEAYFEPISFGRMMFTRSVLVSDPAAVKRVMVDNVANYPKTEMERRFFTALFGAGLLGTDGDLWRRHRRIMAPAFDPRSVAGYGPAISRACEAFTPAWRDKADGAVVDVAADMNHLALRIIASTMFAADTDDVIGLVSATMAEGFDNQDFSILDLVPVISGIRMRRRIARMAEKFRPLDAAIERMMADRETAGSPATDLLARLIAARDDESGAGMTAKEIRDQVVTIFIAGHETTAQTMSWIWFLLSQHPREMARLQTELDQVLGGRTPVQEDLPKLAFTRRVVEESMRLYPPAPGLSTRDCLADDELAGHRVKKGDAIIIAPWVLHRHRTLWDEPERFDPDRFLPERSAGRPRFAYLPFGAGPRVCIGQVLAMNEAILILASLAQHVSAELAPDCVVTPVANITLRPKNGLRMILRPRRSGH